MVDNEVPKKKDTKVKYELDANLMFLFGGYKNGSAMNDLWMIRPCSTQKSVSKERNSHKSKIAPTIYSFEAVELQPEGKPPVARAMHSS